MCLYVRSIVAHNFDEAARGSPFGIALQTGTAAANAKLQADSALLRRTAPGPTRELAQQKLIVISIVLLSPEVIEIVYSEYETRYAERPYTYMHSCINIYVCLYTHIRATQDI